MRRRLRTPVLGLIVFLAVPLAAAAQTSPEARQWLDKMAEAASRSFELDMEIEMGTAVKSPAPIANFKGHMVQKDREHMRVDTSMDMTPPQGGGTIPMKVLTVIDGEYLWNEMDLGPMGKRITRTSLSTMKEMEGLAGAAAANIDPISQIEDLAAMVHFEVESASDTEVVLKGTPTGEGGMINFGGSPIPNAGAVTLSLDPATAYPRRLVFGGDEPFATMIFNNVKAVDPASLDAADFSYEPPDGVPVYVTEENLEMMERMRQQKGQ